VSVKACISANYCQSISFEWNKWKQSRQVLTRHLLLGLVIFDLNQIIKYNVKNLQNPIKFVIEKTNDPIQAKFELLKASNLTQSIFVNHKITIKSNVSIHVQIKPTNNKQNGLFDFA